MKRAATAYVIDDDLFVRAALEQVLTDAKIPVATYASASDFLASYSPQDPGCIVVDVMMPGMNGLELQKILVEKGNFTPLIFLSGAEKVHFAVEALKAGAIDFLEKPVKPADLIERVTQAIEADLNNRFKRLQHSHLALKMERLTPRELEIMQWLIQGKANKAIAKVLDISSRTVEIHRKNVLAKMDVKSVVELATMVIELPVR